MSITSDQIRTVGFIHGLADDAADEIEELEKEVAALKVEPDAAMKDAERYRFIRDADRSDCITRELSLYALESLDEYVDAAMEDEARAAIAKIERDTAR